MRLVTELLDEAAAKYPEKMSFSDENREDTYLELQLSAQRIGMNIHNKGYLHSPICIYMPKSVNCVEAILAVSYSGNFYSVVDVEMPQVRIEKIIEVMKPVAVVTTLQYRDQARTVFGNNIDYVIYEEAMNEKTDATVLQEIRSQIDPNEPMFLLFTSGSTGIPKGVVISHRAEYYYLEWIGPHHGLDDGNMILANQAPLYFIMATFDLYVTIHGFGHCYLIPKWYFSFPVTLLDYLKERHVNTLNFVPSALCLIADFRALPEIHLDELKVVVFGGEVMPVRQLNLWIREYPNVLFADLYGATEVTDTLTWYFIPGELDENESIPIGQTASHMQTMILDEEDHPVPVGEVGELCATGPSLADGYYGDPERTREVFVPNPLFQDGDPEYTRIMYRMGDLVRMRDDGNMIYIGRKDFQIKHMGHRIELGEIEAAAASVMGIRRNCCLYDSERAQIILLYSGNLDEEEIVTKLSAIIPDYMIPTEVYKLDDLPLTANGKIDRALLRKKYLN